MVMTSSVCIVFSLSEAGAPQEVPARCQVSEDAVGVARVPFLLDGDISRVSDLIEQIPQSEIVDPAATDRAHDPLCAGVEEPDATFHDVGIFCCVDVLEMDVVGATGVAPKSLDWVHPRVVHMTGVEAESCNFTLNVFGNTIQLVLKLNIAASMRVDDRADVVTIARQFADGANVGNHPIAVLGIESRRPI